jgi:hypothetical protein
MIYELTVTQFTKMLQNLDAILDKAAAHADVKKFDVNVLMSARLAPDQFEFVRQVQTACDTAKLGAARLTGKDAPVHEDKEKTFPELRTRVRETIAFLKTLKESDYVNAGTQRITQPRWQGKWLTGHEYVVHHVIPNFYFHFTTAYAILRHNGVDVGKKDYLGAMPYHEG